VRAGSCVADLVVPFFTADVTRSIIPVPCCLGRGGRGSQSGEVPGEQGSPTPGALQCPLTRATPSHGSSANEAARFMICWSLIGRVRSRG